MKRRSIPINILYVLGGAIAGLFGGRVMVPAPEAEPSPVEEPVPLPDPGGVALLTPPLTGHHRAPNWFNHDLTLDKGQLVYTGKVQGGKTRHVGYDWMAPEGTPVFAAADGVVAKAVHDGVDNCPKMNPPQRPARLVKLAHPNAPDGQSYSTLYLHLLRVDVTEGQQVRAGQQIGLTGNSGCSSAPHLHFGVSRNGQSVDPYGWEGTSPDPYPGTGPNLWITAPALAHSDEVVED